MKKRILALLLSLSFCISILPTALASPIQADGYMTDSRMETSSATGELSVEHAPLPSPSAEPVFSDVPAGSWFAQGVAACARKGILVGTGGDAFSPEATLTYPECVMLAFRLYDKAHGGDGSLLKAPEDWGYMTIDTDDGKLHYGGFPGTSMCGATPPSLPAGNGISMSGPRIWRCCTCSTPIPTLRIAAPP